MSNLELIKAQALAFYPHARIVGNEVHVSLDGSSWTVFHGKNKYSWD